MNESNIIRYPLMKVAKQHLAFITEDFKRVDVWTEKNKRNKILVKCEVTGYHSGKVFTNWNLSSILNDLEIASLKEYIKSM